MAMAFLATPMTRLPPTVVCKRSMEFTSSLCNNQLCGVQRHAMDQDCPQRMRTYRAVQYNS